MARQFGGDMTANRPQDLIAALMFKREVWGGQGGGGGLEVGRGVCGKHNLHQGKGGPQEPR